VWGLRETARAVSVAGKAGNGRENLITIFILIIFYLVSNENGKVKNRRSVKFGIKTDKSEQKCLDINQQMII
jgi:hypothetical protein